MSALGQKAKYYSPRAHVFRCSPDNGQSAERRKAVRQELSAPLVADLQAWMREQRAKLSRGNDVAKAMDYMLKRWTAFTRFLEDGRIRHSRSGWSMPSRLCKVRPAMTVASCQAACLSGNSSPTKSSSGR
jgi:hypothetical protein